MSALDGMGGIDLGGVQVVVTEIVTYPLAVVAVRPDGLGLGDATHHLSIVLPQHGRELRIPYNKHGLRKLGRDAQSAGGVPQATNYESEGN